MSTSRLFLVTVAMALPLSFASAEPAPSNSPANSETVRTHWVTPTKVHIDCEFSLAQAIAYVPREVHRLEVLDGVGLVLNRGEQFPDDLLPGMYLYESYRDRSLGYVPRHDIAAYVSTGRGTHTHEAVERAKVRQTGEDIGDKVVGAGEGYMAFGEFWRINNKSGRRPDVKPSLELSFKAIQRHGGIVNAATEKIYMDRNDPMDEGHTPADVDYDEWIVTQMELVLTQPEGVQLVKLLDRFGRLLRRYIEHGYDPDTSRRLGIRIPPQERRGGVRDLDTFLTMLLRGDASNLVSFPLQYIFRSASHTDSIYFGICTHWNNLASGKASAHENLKYTVPLMISRILVKLGPLLMQNEFDLAELHDLSLQFSRLPERNVDPLFLGKLEALKKPEMYVVKKPSPTPR